MASGEPDAAAVRPGSSAKRLRVVAIADLNGRYGSTRYGASVHRAIERIVELRPDLVLVVGDMVAGQREGLDYGAMWQAFHAAVSDPIAAVGIPIAVTPGNHDASAYDRYAAERPVYVAQWASRRPALDFVDGAGYPLRYSFAMGPALFVAMDATTLGRMEAEDRAWVRAQLRAGRSRPVRVVFGHVPIYPLAEGMGGEALHDQELERILVRGRTTLLVSGHSHVYYPGRRDGLRLASVGALGSGQRRLPGDAAEQPPSFVLVDIGPEGIERLDALVEPDFEQAIDRRTLPPRVGVEPEAIDRDDL